VNNTFYRPANQNNGGFRPFSNNQPTRSYTPSTFGGGGARPSFGGGGGGGFSRPGHH
jgi:hypothetical protein